jgi:tetratricopeptide (TPR) repeat protein
MTPVYKGILCCLILILRCLPLSASEPATYRQRVEARISAFQFTHAQALIPLIPNRGYQAFYQSHILAYKYLATQDPAWLAELRGQWGDALRTVESIPASDPARTGFLADLYCKRAAAEFMAENYLTAIRLAKTGYGYLQETPPGRPEALKLRGLFHVLFGAVPSRYQWLTQMLGFEGDVATGIALLEQAQAGGATLRMEAVVLLFYTQRNLLNDPQAALSRLDAEVQAHGPSFPLDYLRASALLSLRHTDEALSILRRKPSYLSEQVFWSPYWDYLQGKAQYFRNDWDQARSSLGEFTRTCKGSLFLTDAIFRLGMAELLAGRQEAAQPWFARIARERSGGFDEDAYAASMAWQFLQVPPSQATLDLFRARNYFDGGYFDRARETFGQIEALAAALSPAEAAELQYRYGRLEHLCSRYPQAQQRYQAALEIPLEGPARYVQAYSLFYLGELERERGSREAARRYFEQALRMDQYHYQSGLESKIKPALTALRSKP